MEAPQNAEEGIEELQAQSEDQVSSSSETISETGSKSSSADYCELDEAEGGDSTEEKEEEAVAGTASGSSQYSSNAHTMTGVGSPSGVARVPKRQSRAARVPKKQKTRVVAELLYEGQEFVLACGGVGGIGNGVQPTTPGRPPPSTAEPGLKGTTAKLLLETKTLANVAFVGMPNVGKSSLLGALTAARAKPGPLTAAAIVVLATARAKGGEARANGKRPLLGALTAARAKVGSHAFTTLMPQLGTVLFPDGATLTSADVPGLIPGATTVGSHAFTTLMPQLGTVLFPDGATLTSADVPGLIPGATTVGSHAFTTLMPQLGTVLFPDGANATLRLMSQD
eukprot:gene3785-13853_t